MNFFNLHVSFKTAMNFPGIELDKWRRFKKYKQNNQIKYYRKRTKKQNKTKQNKKTKNNNKQNTF